MNGNSWPVYALVSKPFLVCPFMFLWPETLTVHSCYPAYHQAWERALALPRKLLLCALSYLNLCAFTTSEVPTHLMFISVSSLFILKLMLGTSSSRFDSHWARNLLRAEFVLHCFLIFNFLFLVPSSTHCREKVLNAFWLMTWINA